MQLVEKLYSLVFISTELVLIAEHIQLFFSKYVKPFDDVKFKPKARFIFHYPHKVWFQAKNGYFKGLYSNNKHWKNMSV